MNEKINKLINILIKFQKIFRMIKEMKESNV